MTVIIGGGTDIEIGSVEIKGGDTNDRADVVLRGDGKYALATDATFSGSINIHPSSTFLEYQNASTVPTDTTQTVLDFTNTASTFYINRFTGTGTANAEWFLFIDDVLKMVRRTTASQMTLDMPMDQFIIGHNVNVKVKVKHAESATQDFDCTMNYER